MEVGFGFERGLMRTSIPGFDCVFVVEFGVAFGVA
jgi:hypothetical protein